MGGDAGEVGPVGGRRGGHGIILSRSRESRTLPWIPIALAAPPDGLVLDDPSPWILASEALLDGPSGCVEVVGRASWSHDFARWGSTRGDAVFTGRLRDGVWGEIALFPLGMIDDDARGAPDPEIYAAEQRFTPLIGRVRGLAVGLDRDRTMTVRRSDDVRVDPVNTVRDVLDRLSRGTETAWVRWDDADASLVLVRDREVGRSRSGLSADVVFPGGGLAPSRWTVHLDRPYRHDALGLARVTALDVVLDVAPDGTPRAESLATTLDLAGVRITARQRLIYTSVVGCVSATDGSPPRAPATGSPPP